MKFIQTAKRKHKSFTKETVLCLLREHGYLSTAMIQREFTVGYAKASRMIDALAEKGHVKHDGQRWVENDKE